MAVVVPDLAELFEEAFERAGLEMRTGYDAKTARRSLNIMTLEWQNRGLNLFTIEAGTLPLVTGTATYTLPTDTIDLIEHQLRTDSGTSQQLDSYIQRMSVSTYAQQGNKNTQGRPSQIYVQRNATDVTVTLWPIPNSATTYELFYYRLKGIDSATSIAGDTNSIPPRFVPALVSGLAYYIAMKKPEVADRVIPLKQEYEEQFRMAANQDQDRSTLQIVPFRGAM